MLGMLRGIAVPAFLLFFSTYVSLVAADVVARLLFSQPERDTGSLFLSDPERGHAMRPNFRGEITTGYKYLVTTNSRGYRDEEWSLTADVRVVVLGDSFTFGEPLPVEQGFVAKATKMFGGRVRFFNLGVSGYGPAQELVTLKKECSYIKPTHVFYMFYLNDTAWDNVRADATTVVDGFVVHGIDRGGTRRFSIEEVRKKVSDELAQRRLRASDIISLKNLRVLISARLDGFFGGSSTGSPQTSGGDYSDHDTRLAAEKISEMDRAATDCGATFTMVILPSRWEMALSVQEPQTNMLLRLLSTSSRKFEIIDLRDRPRRAMDLGLPRDNHYNSAATSWIAEELANALVVRHDNLRNGIN